MLILGMSVTFFDGVGFGFPACVITTARPWVDFWPFWDEICVSKLSTTTSTKAFYCQSQLSLVFLSPWPLQQKFWNDTVHCTMVLSHWSIFVSIVLCDDRQEIFYTKRTLHNEKKMYKWMLIEFISFYIIIACNFKVCLWPQHPFSQPQLPIFVSWLEEGHWNSVMGVFKVNGCSSHFAVQKSPFVMDEWSSTLAVSPSVSRTFAIFPLFFKYMYVPFNSSAFCSTSAKWD